MFWRETGSCEELEEVDTRDSCGMTAAAMAGRMGERFAAAGFEGGAMSGRTAGADITQRSAAPCFRRSWNVTISIWTRIA